MKTKATVNGKNKKEAQDFFERMQSHQMDRLNKAIIILSTIFFFSFAILLISLILNIGNWVKDSKILSPILYTSLALSAVSAIVVFVVLFFQNSILFRQGNIRYGIFNFVVLVVFIYFALFVGYFSGTDAIKDFFKTLIVPVTTLFAAVLAIIGVHYNISRQREENEYKRNLLFVLKQDKGESIVLQSLDNNISLSINIQNCSNNAGYLVGFYRLNGGEVYKIAELPYTPILPQTNYTISNIVFNESDDQIIMIYTDINEVCYYLLFDINGKNTVQIKQNDKCDWYYFKDALARSMDSMDDCELHKINEAIRTTYTIEDEIIARKVNTRPINTKRIGNYEYIVDSAGELLTDSSLLEVLRKERLKIAREQKNPAYMIFNNQQLVALATYKPTNREEFISIFNLGEGKYSMFGARFIDIIKNFESEIK